MFPSGLNKRLVLPSPSCLTLHVQMVFTTTGVRVRAIIEALLDFPALPEPQK